MDNMGEDGCRFEVSYKIILFRRVGRQELAIKPRISLLED
jgi:hypothetical protein